MSEYEMELIQIFHIAQQSGILEQEIFSLFKMQNKQKKALCKGALQKLLYEKIS